MAFPTVITLAANRVVKACTRSSKLDYDTPLSPETRKPSRFSESSGCQRGAAPRSRQASRARLQSRLLEIQGRKKHWFWALNMLILLLLLLLLLLLPLRLLLLLLLLFLLLHLLLLLLLLVLLLLLLLSSSSSRHGGGGSGGGSGSASRSSKRKH